MKGLGVHHLAYLFLWIGGINWGLWGLFGYNLVDSLFGADSGVTRVVYVLVGLSALYTLFTHKSYCKICSEMMKK